MNLKDNNEVGEPPCGLVGHRAGNTVIWHGTRFFVKNHTKGPTIPLMFYNCLYTICVILLNEYLDNCNNLLKSGIICDIIISDPVSAELVVFSGTGKRFAHRLRRLPFGTCRCCICRKVGSFTPQTRGLKK